MAKPLGIGVLVIGAVLLWGFWLAERAERYLARRRRLTPRLQPQ